MSFNLWPFSVFFSSEIIGVFPSIFINIFPFSKSSNDCKKQKKQKKQKIYIDK